MPSYTFDSWNYYNRSGDSMSPDTVIGYGTDVSTVTEVGDVDNSLDPNENDLDNDWGATGSVTYFGTLSHGGRTFLVFQDSFNYFLGIAETGVPQVEFPTNWDFASVTVVSTPICFAEGTMIATPEGETAVEALRVGDMLKTAGGQAVPVKWVGKQTLFSALHGAKAQPVRISAGALAPGMPDRDLIVTADHGMVLDGHIINASALVNGTTIDFVPVHELPDRFTVYHVETEAHDIIYAHGAETETFIDATGRAAFDNHEEYLDLYGAERVIPEQRLPRITSARMLPDTIKARLGLETTAPVTQALSA